jgi:hypothetical protein
MQLRLQLSCRQRLHGSSGLQRVQAIRMTRISEPGSLAEGTDGGSSDGCKQQIPRLRLRNDKVLWWIPAWATRKPCHSENGV